MNIMDYQKEVRKMDKDEDINQLTDLFWRDFDMRKNFCAQP